MIKTRYASYKRWMEININRGKRTKNENLVDRYFMMLDLWFQAKYNETVDNINELIM